jgi:Uncharacterized protein conserved in bacteria (DUF2325)
MNLSVVTERKCVEREGCELPKCAISLCPQGHNEADEPVSTRPILHCNHDSSLAGLFSREKVDLPFTDPKSERRCKIWDLSTNLHCSIIGTCLTAAELRQFFTKMGDLDAKTATDHSLHGRGVSAAGRHDLAGKLLHKTLDKRHETAIKRFAKGSTAAQVRGLWREALEQGAIPGAYWAVLTHPATDHALVQEVFGAVHMLSHMVGASNRVDIARLRQLQDELGERDEKIARQEMRLMAAARDREALLGKIADLEASVIRHQGTIEHAKTDGPTNATAVPLRERLAEEKAHSHAQAERLHILEERVRKSDALIAELTERSRLTERELSILEEALSRESANAPGPNAIAENIRGLRLLYVGGRPKLVDQLKTLTAQRDGLLLAHDGGVEDNAALLPGLVSQADRIFFPVDCISHDAAGRVKKLCRRLCSCQTTSVAQHRSTDSCPTWNSTILSTSRPRRSCRPSWPSSNGCRVRTDVKLHQRMRIEER